MLAKLSLKSFLYELIETFMFLNKTTKNAFEKYGADFVYIYQLLTDTDSTSIQYIIICDEDNQIKDSEFRNMIFEVVSKNEIFERFNISQDFWSQFGVQDKNT